MIDREAKIIKLSILVLCFALIFVYLIRFYVKGDELDITNTHTHEDIQGQNISSGDDNTNIDNDADDKIATINTQNTDEQESTEPQQPTIQITEHSNDENEVIIQANPESQDINIQVPAEETEIEISENDIFTPPTVVEREILPGTYLVENSIDIAEVLGIKYMYALRDNKGIEYLYLGEGLNNDLVEIVNQYEGTIHTIDTEYEIKKNELFGERVIFLNLPGYYKKLVLMVVKHNDAYWLINIDYPLYHKSKNYLKNLFTD